MKFGLSLPRFQQVASPEAIRRVAQRAEQLGYDGMVLWTQDKPTFHGQFVRFENIAFEPKPVQTPQ